MTLAKLVFVSFILIVQLNAIKSEAFDEFLTYFGRQDTLKTHDLNNITQTLLNRLGCNSQVHDCDQCLSSPKFQFSGLIGSEVNRQEFKNVSIVIYSYLLDLNQFCVKNSIPSYQRSLKSLTLKNGQFSLETLYNQITQNLASNYKIQMNSPINDYSSINCIEVDTYINRYNLGNATHLEDTLVFTSIISDLISSLYQNAQIGCDLPMSNWFLDTLVGKLNKSQESKAIDALNELMNDMHLSPNYSRFQSRYGQKSNRLSFERCYSVDELARIYRITNETKLSEIDIRELAPSLIYLSSNRDCLKRNNLRVLLKDDGERDDEPSKRPTDAEKYGYGTIAVVIISLLALVGIVLLPCFKKQIYNDILIALSALACSTLFSDAMLHLIPEILGIEHGAHRHADNHDHNDESISVPDHVIRTCVAIGALYASWLVNVISSRMGVGHGHSHSIHNEAENEQQENENKVSITQQKQHQQQQQLQQQQVNGNDNLAISYNTFTTESASSEAHTHSDIIFPAVAPKFSGQNGFMTMRTVNKTRERKWQHGLCAFGRIKSAGVTILASDAIHNFADGLAIGASFAESTALGLSTTLAIFCHEIPHELGNYAVLIKSGFSHLQALLFNLLSACTCIIGFYIGASVAANETVSQYIFSLTTGMFLYVALVEILPEIQMYLLKKWSIKLFLVINVFLWIGFAIMFLLVIFEDKIQF